MDLHGLHYSFVPIARVGRPKSPGHHQIAQHLLRIHKCHVPKLVLAQKLRPLLLLLPDRQLEEEKGRVGVLCVLHLQRLEALIGGRRSSIGHQRHHFVLIWQVGELDYGPLGILWRWLAQSWCHHYHAFHFDHVGMFGAAAARRGCHVCASAVLYPRQPQGVLLSQGEQPEAMSPSSHSYHFTCYPFVGR